MTLTSQVALKQLKFRTVFPDFRAATG